MTECNKMALKNEIRDETKLVYVREQNLSKLLNK